MNKTKKYRKHMSMGTKWIITMILFILAIVTVVLCAKSGAFHFEAGKITANDNESQISENESESEDNDAEDSDAEEYTVFVTAGNGGTANPSGSITVDAWDSISLSFTPDEGYIIESVTLDGEDLGAIDSYSLSYIDENHTIVVTFDQEPEPTEDPNASLDSKIADEVSDFVEKIIEGVSEDKDD